MPNQNRNLDKNNIACLFLVATAFSMPFVCVHKINAFKNWSKCHQICLFLLHATKQFMFKMRPLEKYGGMFFRKSYIRICQETIGVRGDGYNDVDNIFLYIYMGIETDNF